jgi:hypothetical protein
MDEQEWLAERFEEQRGRLRAVAYRMLGSLSEADDAVQDTWIEVFSVGAVTIRGGRIVELDFLGDPERLRRLDLTFLDR